MVDGHAYIYILEGRKKENDEEAGDLEQMASKLLYITSGRRILDPKEKEEKNEGETGHWFTAGSSGGVKRRRTREEFASKGLGCFRQAREVENKRREANIYSGTDEDDEWFSHGVCCGCTPAAWCPSSLCRT